VSFDGLRIRIGVVNLRIRVHAHRPLPEGALLKAAVFTRAPGGRKWHVCLQCVIPPAATRRCQSQTAATVGIDVGVAPAIAQSDPAAPPRQAGRQGDPPRAACARPRQARQQARRAKTRARLARALHRIADTRRRWAHKQAARLTHSYAVIDRLRYQQLRGALFGGGQPGAGGIDSPILLPQSRRSRAAASRRSCPSSALR
jgi:hypothetical protein